ncbi:MAG: AI-2E family transporter, partial [Candidatus Woesearchaeota archaeon]
MARHVRKGRIIIVSIMILLSIVALMIMAPFFQAILGALVISYMFLPLQQALVRRTRMPGLSAAIVLAIIAFFVIIPLILSGFLLIREVQSIVGSTGMGFTQALETMELPEYLSEFVERHDLENYFRGAVIDLADRVIGNLDRILLNMFYLGLQLFVFAFLTFFFLRDYSTIQKLVRHVSHNLLTKDDAHLLDTYFSRVGTNVNLVVRGTIITALVQVLLLVPAYYLLGIQTPLIWGILTFFVSLMPVIGVPFVWVPLTLFKIFEALTLGDQGLLIRAIVVIVWGTLVVGQIDNFIKPAIIGKQARTHPTVVLLGIIGGLPVFGFIGIIVGPVVLTMVIMFFNTFFVERPEES